MNPALRASAAHVFVDDLHSPSLSADDEHHLFRVMRLRSGELVTISDGHGGWRSTVVEDHALAPIGEAVSEASPPPITIASAIPKGDRLEWMVQKLTELGVSDMVFVDCERSVVKWTSERGAQQLLRLTRVAREAAMQSRRVWLPALRGPFDYADVIALPGAVIADPDGGSLADLDNDPHSGRIVVIGP
ncbi:MAG: 16S rRNA (uracil(1498)-N(3))-methyltransferase, partial [Actinobacteria bacterium]|nr:16S rRNA (uracil(1498)-N(3))-methyltransferase [Actinomycetota bacterium]